MASTAGAVPSSPATRAKTLPDDAPGVYALRKRRRDSSNQTADTDSPADSQATRVRTERVNKSPEIATTGSQAPVTVNGLTDDVTATATAAPPALQPPSSVTHGQALPAPTPSASTSQAPMLSGQEENEDGDHSGDESDLTSLSELEERLERETAQLPPRPRRARDISGRKTPRKRKTAMSSAASSPAASSSVSTAASEYRPADETDHGGSSELDPALPMDVDVPRPRKGSANPKVRKTVSKKQQQASKPRRVAAASKAPPAQRQPPAPAPTLQASRAQTPRPIKLAPASANKAQHMEVVALPPPTQAPKRKRALPQANPAQPSLPLAPAQDQHDAVPTGTPRLTSLTSFFQPAAMPSVMSLYEQRHQVLKDARLEATGGLAFQLRSEALIEAAISALDRRDQQDGLCLTMNRYSAFCDLKSVDVPPFPVTAAKVTLFLARAPATALSTLLLSAFPQPARFPLPIAGVADPNLTAVEGTRVSRELVRFWVEALAYAQRATNEVWAPIFDGAGPVQQGPQPDHIHPSLEPLQNNVAIQEILAAVETSESIVHADEVARQMRENRRDASHTSGTTTTAVAEPPQPTKQGKTKWIKGGKPVAPPPAPPPASSSGKTASSDQGFTRSAPISNPTETRHAPPATRNDAATRPAARHSPTKPVELWQVTQGQVSPVLPIASAPISIPGRQASVASTSHATLDLGRRRRSTTSDLALVDSRVPLPSSSWQQQQQQQQQQERPHHQQHQQRDYRQQQHQQQQRPQTWQHANDFPPPVSVGAANALQGVHPGEDPYPWAQQFPHQAFAMQPEPARRHSRASTYAFEMSHATQWESPYEAVNGTDVANYATSLAVEQQVTQMPFDQVPFDGYLDANTAPHNGYDYGAASGSALPIRASPFDMLAAVANDRMSAEPDLSQHIASYDHQLPLSSVNGEGVLAGAASSVPMRRGIEHFAGRTSQGGFPTPWASSDSSRRGSRAEPFDPSLADPSLSGLLHTRSQPHDHTFVASDSHFGHIADSALASIGPLDAGMTYDAGSVSHSHSHPQSHPHPHQPMYVRPSAYPTPDSPWTERWPMQQGNATWAASPTGIDAAFLQQVLSEQVGPAPENNLEPPTADAASSPPSYTAYGLGLSYA